jgi:hypothetical protein
MVQWLVRQTREMDVVGLNPASSVARKKHSTKSFFILPSVFFASVFLQKALDKEFFADKIFGECSCVCRVPLALGKTDESGSA